MPACMPASNAARSRTSATTGTTFRPAARHQLRGVVEIRFSRQRVGDRVDIGADIDGDDVGALLGQGDGMAAALAAGRAGDDRDGVV